MGRPISCRQCGALFLPEPLDVVARRRRLCPRCRGMLPPTGGSPAAYDLIRLPAPLVPEVAP
jgi:hypothetical protein